MTCAVDGCGKPVKAREWCSAHLTRYYRTGDPEGTRRLPPRPATDRFLEYVVRTGEESCWLWVGATTQGGYGQLSANGRHYLAHRFAYEQWVGLIPDGLQIDHLCRVRNCVNPLHLEPVTREENIRRAQRPRTHCKHGHEWTEENTYFRPHDGYRMCRECMRLSDRRLRARRKERRLYGTADHGEAVALADALEDEGLVLK